MRYPVAGDWLSFLSLTLPLLFLTFLHEHFILPRIFLFGLVALPLVPEALRKFHPGIGRPVQGAVLLLVSGGLSVFFSPSPRLMLPGAALLASVLILALVWEPGRDEERVLHWLQPAFAAVVAYGFVQLIGLDPLHWNARDAVGRAAVFSTLGNVNWLAAWLAVSLHLLFRSQAGRGRILLLTSGLLLLLATRSRGALLGFLVGFGLRIFSESRWNPSAWRGWIRRALVALLVLLLVSEVGLLLAGQPTLSGRLAAGQGLKDRLFIAGTALSLLPECLPFGCGYGNFAYRYPDALARRLDPMRPEQVRLSAHANHVHCDMLEVLLEAGPLGLIGFVLLFFLPLVWGIRAADEPARRGAAALACFLVCGLFDSPFYHPATLFLATLAALLAMETPRPRRSAELFLPAFLRHLLLFAFALLVLRGIGGQLVASWYLARAQPLLAAVVDARGDVDPARVPGQLPRLLKSAVAWSAAEGLAAMQLGSLELARGRPREAAAFLRLAGETLVEPALEYNRGLAAVQLGDHRAALGHFRRAAALSPWSPVYARAQAGLGRSLRALGVEGAGLDALFQAFCRDPQFVEGAPAVVEDLARRGRPGLAAALAARLLQGQHLLPDELRAELHAARVLPLLQLDLLPEALAEWRAMEAINAQLDRINLGRRGLLRQLADAAGKAGSPALCFSLALDRLRYEFVAGFLVKDGGAVE